MTMSCDRACFLISKKQDHSLNFKEKVSLRLHLMICAACLHTERQYKRIKEICLTSQTAVCDGPAVKGCCLDKAAKDLMKEKISQASLNNL